MAPRLELQALLVGLLGSSNVYFQPPTSLQMQYPCIIYKRDSINTVFADNQPYKGKKRYQVIAVDRDPDSDIHDKLAALPLCSHDRTYAADDLNHDVFNLFF
jgi:hypothetical protein